MKTWGGMTSPSLGHDADDHHHGGQNLVKSLLVALSDQSTATCYFSSHLLNLCVKFFASKKKMRGLSGGGPEHYHCS